MKTSEKISLLISILAILISLAWSTISYLWLNQYELGYRYSPKIECVMIDHTTKRGYQFEVEIENKGKTAAEDVLVHLKPVADYIKFAPDLAIECEPLCPVESESQREGMVLKLGRTIGPGEVQKLVIRGVVVPEIGGKGLVRCHVYDRTGEAHHYHASSLVDFDVWP